MRTLEDRITHRHLNIGIFVVLFSIFAAIALLLASVGLYAVIADSVSQRTREIGLRMAVGGTSRDIVWLVFAQGRRQVAIGLMIGLITAFGVTCVLRAILVVSPNDPITSCLWWRFSCWQACSVARLQRGGRSGWTRLWHCVVTSGFASAAS